MKRIAVLSSCHDNSGINSAVRAVVRRAKAEGIQTFGVNFGFRGLYEDRISILTSRNVSGKIGKAGCFLGSYSSPENIDSHMQQILYNLNKRSIEGLIVIGDSKSLSLSKSLIGKGVPCVNIPSTLQDDIVGTDITLGLDSAINSIMQCVDHIRSCDSSRNRSFLVQVEGSKSGSLALRSAVTTGAEICLTPENSTEDLSVIADQFQKCFDLGKTQSIAIISSGWKPGLDKLSDFLQKNDKDNDILVRKTVLGYIQRGIMPTGFDRLLGTNMGALAVDALVDGYSGHFIGLQGNKYERVPNDEAIGKVKPLNQSYVKLFAETNK